MKNRTMLNPVTHQGNNGLDHQYFPEGTPDRKRFSEADGNSGNLRLSNKSISRPDNDSMAYQPPSLRRDVDEENV